MECRAAEVQEYVYELLPGESRERLESHVRQCVDCRRTLHRLSEERERITEAARLWMAAPPRRRSFLPWALAAAALLLGMGAVWVLRGLPSPLHTPVLHWVPPTSSPQNPFRRALAQKSHLVELRTSDGKRGDCARIRPGITYIRLGDSTTLRIGTAVWTCREREWVRTDRTWPDSERILSELAEAWQPDAGLRCALRDGSRVSFSLSQGLPSAITVSDKDGNMAEYWFVRYNQDSRLEPAVPFSSEIEEALRKAE